MQELRFVAVSEDGSYAVLAIPGRSGRYILPIDERLRAVALGQTSRLAQYEIEVESPLRPKEIQARIRAGETAEEIADAAGIPLERVRWFEGPVLAERAYIADRAQSGTVRRAGDASGPGPRLGDIVTERLSAAGSDPADGQWDSRKRGDGNWQVSLTFPSGGRLHVAEWVFDPRRRHVMPDDDNAARLSLPESELPAEPVPVPGEATVTPIASRLGAAAGMGGGSVSGFPGPSRFRPDKSVIPDRSLGADRSLVERPAPMPDRGAAGLSDRAAAPSPPAPSAPASSRPGSSDRPSRPAHPGYAEFPESAPYRAPEPAPEPAAHREQRGYDDPASLSGAFRAPAAEPSAYHDYEDPEPASPAYRTFPEPPAQHEAPPEPRAYREPVGFRAPAAEPPAYREPPEYGEPSAYREPPAFQEPPVYRDPEPAAYRAPDSQPVPRDPRPEPAAHRAPVAEPAHGFDDSEQGRSGPPRPVVFEDPEPAFLDEQVELTSEPAPGRPEPTAPAEQVPPAPVVSAPAGVAASSAPSPALDAPRPAPGSSSAESATHEAAERLALEPTAITTPEPAATERPTAPAAPVSAPAEAPVAAPPERRAPEPAAASAKPSAAAVNTEPAVASTVTEPQGAEPQGAATAGQAASAPEPTAPAEAAPPAPVAVAASVVAAEPAVPAAADATARDAQSATGDPELKAAEPTAPDAEPKAAEPEAEVPAPAEPAEETTARRPGSKKNAKARRSSVPSWDEIMLGSSRQRD